MTTRRWYPTVETLEDGSMIVVRLYQFFSIRLHTDSLLLRSEAAVSNIAFMLQIVLLTIKDLWTSYAEFGGSPLLLPEQTRNLNASTVTLGFLNTESNSNPTFEYFPSKGDPISLPILDRTLVGYSWSFRHRHSTD